MKKTTLMLMTICFCLCGCQEQQSQDQWEYVVQQSKEGYQVKIIGYRFPTFNDDLRTVLQDKRFRKHVIFWMSVCSYLYFTIPTRECPEYILTPKEFFIK